MWHIVQNSNIRFDGLFRDMNSIPYTFSYLIRKRMQIDSWMELPKEKRPPECLAMDTKVIIREHKWVKCVSISYLINTWQHVDILTPFGWKKIINLKSNKQRAVNIRFARRDVITCSHNHRFLVCNKKTKGDYEIEAKDLITNSYYFNCGLFRSIDSFFVDGVDYYKDIKLDYDVGYLVGLYAAEGGGDFNRILLTVGTHELRIVNNIRCILLNLGMLEVPFSSRISDGLFKVGRVKSDKPTVTRIRASSKSLSKLVRFFVGGVCNNKQLNDILNYSLDFRRGVFNGLLDGDGRDLGNGKFSFVSSSKELRDNLSTLASSIGILTSKYNSQALDVRYNKIRSGYHLGSRVGRNGITRKINGNIQLPLTMKKFSNKEVDMVDIEVDGNLFFIDDGLISHNSIWDDAQELEEWFDRIYGDKQTEFNINWNENEVEE